ncbi:LamG-like jellyroll fold domain-containing protein [Rhodopirellula bahusiensis]|nr:LamG-like jellyroll fold domain-containing protein [Rhodopirellula bahusiensis]
MSKRDFHFFQLEDRVLLSGEGLEAIEVVAPDAELLESLNAELDSIDAALNDIDITNVTPDGEARRPKDDPEFFDPADGPITMDPARPIEVIFIDDGVQESDALVQNLRDQSEDTQWVIVRLASDQSGIDQISSALSTLQGVDAIHLVSHGDGEAIQLGSDRLSIDTAPSFAGDIASWGHSLDTDADLLIYGCDLASTVEGQDLIEMLALVCNCDVAASDDATGHEELGGDWILEYTVGDVTTDVAFGYAAQASWHSTLDITSDLVVHHEYDTSGSLTETDASGNGNDGTWVNDPAWTSDAAVGEYAMDFSQDGSGANSVVEIADDPSLDFSGDFTVSFWYNADALQADSTRLIGSHDGSDGFSIYTNSDGSLNLFLQGSTTSATSLATSGFVADGNWHHVTATRSGNDLRLYVDGTSSGPTTSNVGVVDVSSTVTIGGSSVAGTDYEGKLDDVRIYTRALSDDDIDTLILKSAGIQVDTFADTLDGDTTSLSALYADKGSDGFISLREAIIAANNTAGADTIVLGAGTYVLDLAGQFENASATGDLDVTSQITIQGDGLDTTILDASSLGDRIFYLANAGDLTISDMTLTGASSGTEEGAAVYNEGEFTATDVAFTDNTVANVGGGAIYSRGTTTLDRTAFIGNTSGASGGAIHVFDGTTTITNSTISGNQAEFYGGGIYAENAGSTVTILHSTIADNNTLDTNGYGGGVYITAATFNAEASIFADNTSNLGGSDVHGTIVSGGYNIVEHNSGFSGTVGTDILGSDPALAALSVDASSGQSVHAINIDSIAYNAATGSSTVEDQRGVARDGSPDIGAYEYVAPPELLAHYKFDAGSGATDSSANGLNGVLQGDASVDTTSGTNQVGDGKLTLDGTGDYVDLSANVGSFANLTAGTISTWVKLSSSDFSTIFDISDGATSNFASLWVENGNLIWAVNAGGSSLMRATSTATINDDTWHHVAVTTDSSGTSLFIDGVKLTGGDVTYSQGDASTTTFFNDLTGPSSVKLGAYDIGSVGGEFTGLMDDIRVYNYAVNESDMAELHAYRSDTPTDLSTTATNAGGLNINDDGGNDLYLLADDGSSILGGLSSLSYEVQFESTVAGGGVPLLSYATGSNSNEVLLYITTTGDLQLTIAGSNAYSDAMDYRSLLDGQTHSLGFTWDGGTGEWVFYVDGEVADSRVLAGDPLLQQGYTTASGGELLFGQEQDSVEGTFQSDQVFSGTFFNARVFDDARTEAEMAGSYRTELPFDESGMLAQWNFNDISGDGVVTESVSGNNLTIKHTSESGFTASEAALTLAIDENTISGSVVGSVSGQDAEREARIASLLAADANLRYSAETGKFYKLTNVSSAWTTAQSSANSNVLGGVSGQLLTIGSAAENELATLFANQLGGDVWLGYSDQVVEGEFQEYTGTTAGKVVWRGAASGYRVDDAYSNWAPAEPNDDGGQDFAKLYVNGTWDDEGSGAMVRSIVEWNADAVLDATDAVTYTIQSQTVVGAFEIDASTGTITVGNGSLLDYESQASHSLTVRVTDEDSNTYDEVFTVSLNDLVESNNAPSDLSSGIELNTDGGNDSYLQLADGSPVLGGLGEVTFEASFQVDSAPTGYIALIDYWEGGIANEFTAGINADGTLFISIADSTPESTTQSFAELLDGDQHHFAVSWDQNNGNVRFYVDGQYVETITSQGTGYTLYDSPTVGLIIGQDSDDGGDIYAANAFQGTLYDVRIWDQVRSDAEIELNYQNKFDSGSLPTGLVANWQMDGFNGSNEVVDLVSGNNLSVGHAVGAGFTASTPVEDLHVAENATSGSTVGFVLPSAPEVAEDIASDGLFNEATPSTTQYGVTGTFGDWTVTEASIDLFATSDWESPLGGRVVNLDGSAPGAIEQNLTTVAGRQYQVVFALTGDFSGGDTVKNLRVSASGTSADFQATQESNWSWGETGAFEQRSFTFTADDATSVLQFRSLEGPTSTYGPYIADVQVIEIPAAVTTILNDDPTLSYDAATGKFYKLVTNAVDVTTAMSSASSDLINGVGGQLVTIRSSYENELVQDIVSRAGSEFYIGGTDATSEGSWNWIEDGVEADNFWVGDELGAAPAGAYANFNSIEPNDFGGNEDYLAIYGSTGEWLDLSGADNRGYIIEWNASEVLSNFTFSLSDDAGGRFAIDSNTGEITVVDGSLLNHEASDSHSIDVTVSDAAGNSYNETMTVAVDDVSEAPTDLSVGVALNSDGGNDAYLVDNSSGVPYWDGLTGITMEFAISDLQTPADMATLYSRQSGGSGSYLAIHADGTLDWTGYESTGTYSQLFDGDLHTVAFSWDTPGGELRFYVDGVFAESIVTGTQANTNGGGAFVLGQDQDGGAESGFDSTQHFSGTFHDVRVWDHVRADSDIAEHDNYKLDFTSAEAASAGLLANWQFDGFVSGEIVDIANGYVLTVGQATGTGYVAGAARDTLAVDEMASNGTQVGFAVAHDADANDTFNYTLLDTAGGRFAIDLSTGEITVADGSLLDFETTTSHDVTVQVMDSSGSTYNETIAITVNDVNDAPVMTASSPTYPATEDGAPFTASVAAFLGSTVTDADAGAVEGAAIFGSAGSGGTLEYSINGGSSWTTIPTVDSTSALLLRENDLIRFTPDTENGGTLTLDYHAWDQTSGTAGGTADVTTRGGSTAFSTADNTVTVTVADVNDEQVISTNNGATFNEGSAGNTITSSMLETTDVDNTAGELTYTVTANPSYGQLKLDGLVTTSFTQSEIDAGRITYDHDDSENLADSFSFSVDDGAGSASTGSFSITLNPINDNIVAITSNGGGATASVNVNETVSFVTQVTVSDADMPGDTMTYSIIGGTDQNDFAIDASGNLTFVSSPDFESPDDSDLDNVYEVTVQVSDGVYTDSQTITVTVQDVQSTLLNVTTTSDVDDTGLGATYTIEELYAVGGGTDGEVSLREAITAANGTLGQDTINFSILNSDAGYTGTDGVDAHWQISLTAALPTITESVILDGTSQTSFGGDTNPGTLGVVTEVGVNDTAIAGVERPEIEIIGDSTLDNGLLISADNVTVTGFAMYGFSKGGAAAIEITDAVINTSVTGNIFGSGATGISDPGLALNNTSGVIADGADNGNIAGNIFAFSKSKGIQALNAADGWSITGNQFIDIGLNASNGDAIGINASSGITIDGNYLSGTSTQALYTGSGTNNITFSNNTVVNNGVGPTSGTHIQYDAIALRGGSYDVTIAHNIIANNYGAGIAVNDGAYGIEITENSIYGNGTVLSRQGDAASGIIGIDLQNSSDNTSFGTAPYYTANDAGDSDTGGNSLQNFPVIDSASTDGTQLAVSGSFNSLAARTYRLEFFLTDEYASGHGQGETYLGSIDVTTDGSGNATFDTNFVAALPSGTLVTATATDLTTNETSEFSQQFAVNDTPHILGSNLVTNGEFTSDASGWNVSGNLDHDSGQMRFGQIGGAPGVLSQTLTTEVGKEYFVTFRYGDGSGTQSQSIQLDVNGSALLLDEAITSDVASTLLQPYSYSFVADSTSTTLTFTDTSADHSGVRGYLDDVEVRAASAPAWADLDYTENDSATVVFPDVNLADVDDTHLESAVVRINANYVSSEDVLAAVDQFGIISSWNSGTGELTLSGTATVEQYETVLASLTYENSDSSPNTATRTIEVIVNDGQGDSNTLSRDVTVESVNDHPYNSGSLPASITVTEDVASNVDLSSVDLRDVDGSGGQDLSIKLSTSTGGSLYATTTAGVTVVGDGTSTLTLTGTRGDLNSFLDNATSVTYQHATPNLNGVAADSIQVAANDNGNTGTGGGTDQVFGDVSVDITAVNDAPTISSGFDTMVGEFGGNTSTSVIGKATLESSNMIAVDSDQSYELSVTAWSGDGASGNYDAGETHYLGFFSYDIDGNQITSQHTGHYAGAADTTLAVDLVAGATEIVLTDATGWYEGSSQNNRSFGWYGYTNSLGETYADYTYTRNVESNLWDADAIDHATGVITLRTAWAGPTILAGEAVRNVSPTGGTYQYPLLSSGSIDETGGDYSISIGGATDTGSTSQTQFRHGTAYIAPLVLANYTGTSNQLNISDFTVATQQGTTVFTEDAGPIAIIDDDFTITDVDDTHAESFTVTLTNGKIGDILNVNEGAINALGISVSGIPSGNLTVDGSITLTLTSDTPDSVTFADYQAALNEITFDNNSHDPDTTDRTMTFVVNDGDVDSATENLVIKVHEVDDAPVVSTTANNPTFTEGGSSVSVFSGTTIDAVELGDTIGSFEISIDGVTDGAHEQYRINSEYIALVDGNEGITDTSGFTYSVSVNAGVATLTISRDFGIGSATAAALINNSGYQNTSETPTGTTRTVTLESVTEFEQDGVNDTTVVGTQSVITIAGVNDAPEFVGPELISNGTFDTDLSGWSTVGSTAYSSGEMNFGGGNAVGPHSASQTIATESGQTYRLTFDYRDGSDLKNQSLQVTVDGDSNLLTTSHIVTDIDGTSFVRYEYTFIADSAPSTITFTDTSDTAGLSDDTNNVDGRIDNISVQQINGHVGTASFTEGGSAFVLDGDLSLFDAEIDAGLDDYNNTELRLSRDGGTSGDDVFGASGNLSALTQSGSLVLNGETIGTVDQNSGGQLTLRFNTNLDADKLNEVLQSITYQNTSEAPPTTVQLNWEFDDGNVGTQQGTGGEQTATAHTIVNITGINDAPVLDYNYSTTFDTITEDDINNAGQTVADILASSGQDILTDVDGDPEGIAIVVSNPGNGTWEYSTDGGTIWADVGTVNNGQALLLESTDLVRFNPNGENGTLANFGFRGWDQTAGTAGTYHNISSTGGDSAFSSNTESAQITVTDVNDAPTVTSPATATVNEGGSLSFDISGAGILDTDDVDGDNLTVTVTADHAAIALSQTTGLTIIDGDGSDGTLQFSGSTADIDAALYGLGYDSQAGYNGSASLVVLVDDGSLTDSTTVAITVNPGQTVFVWDGGGATNDWTDADNWNHDLVPEADDIVVFDATSTKDSDIDSAFAGSVSEIQVSAGYTGTLTQERDFQTTGNFVQSDGTFRTAGHLLDMDGDLTRTGGTMNWGSSRVELAGDFDSTPSMGVGTSTLVFDGSGDQTYTRSGNIYSIDIDKSSGTLTFASNLDLFGDFTHTSGTVDFSGNRVGLNGTTNQTIDADGLTIDDFRVNNTNGTITVVGGLNVDGDLTLTDVDSIDGAAINVAGNVLTTDDDWDGTSLIILDGTNDQQISTDGGTGELGNLEINKASGTVQLLDDIELGGDFTYTSGGWDTNGQTVEFQGHNTTIDSGSATFDNVILNSTVAGTRVIVGTLDVDGDFTFTNAGTLNGGQINVSGDITYSDDSYSGTTMIIADGTGNQTVTATNANAKAEHLTINKGSGTLTFGTDLTINGTLNHVAGSVADLTHTITFGNNSGTIAASAINFDDVIFDSNFSKNISGVLNVGGDLTITSVNALNVGEIRVAGNITSSDTSVGGDAVLTLNGTGTQTISGEDLSDGKLNIDKTSGTAILADDLVLNGSSQGLNVISGTLDLNGHTINATGEVVVNDSVLTGAGTITNDLTVEDDAIIRLSASSTSVYESIAVGGTFTLGLGAQLELDLTGMTAGGYLQDIFTATTLAGTFDSITLVNDSVGFTVYDEYDSPSGAVDIFLNSNPTGGISDVTVDEDAPDTVIDLDAAFSDLEHADNELTYSLIGYSSSEFLDSANVDNGAGTLTLDYAANQHGTTTITVRATDARGESTDVTFNVTVNSIEDAPIISGGPATSSLTETDSGLTDSGTFTVSDADVADEVTAAVDSVAVSGIGASSVPGSLNNATLQSFLSVSPTAILDGTENSDTLTWDFNSGTEAFDFLANGETLVLTYTISATDDSGSTLSDTETVTVTITGTNDGPIALVDSGTATESGGIANATVGSDATGNVLDNDTDADVTDSLTVVGVAAGSQGSASGSVASNVVGSFGTIQIASNGSYTFVVDENNASVQALRTTGDTLQDVFTYTIEDSNGANSTAEITITIQGANDNPHDLATTGLTVVETANNGTSVGTITHSDIDSGDTATFTLTDDANGRFVIDSSSGEVTVADTSQLDNETDTTHNITVRVTDTAGATYDENFAVTITDANEHAVSTPTDSDAAANEVDENVGTGTSVGLTADAFDLDSTNNTITYSLTSNPDNLFQIDLNTGEVTTAAAIDRETHGDSRTIEIQASSSDGSVATQTFDIAINDLDEFNVTVPTDSDANVNEVDENVAVGTSVGVTATAFDLDATNNTITYSLTANPGNLFQIDSSTGEVTVAGSVDRESSASYDITVTATSDDTSTASQSFTININDVNEFVVVANGDVDANANQVNENSAAGVSVGVTVLATDFDATNSDVQYAMFDDAGGRFDVDLNSGVVTVAAGASLDFEANSSHDVIVRGTSDDGTFVDQTFTIQVADINEAPVALDDGVYTVVVGQDTLLNSPHLLANDVDVDSDPLRIVIVAHPANGTLQVDLDGNVTYTPNSGYFGDDSFSYQADDGLLTSNIATVTIDVLGGSTGGSGGSSGGDGGGDSGGDSGGSTGSGDGGDEGSDSSDAPTDSTGDGDADGPATTVGPGGSSGTAGNESTQSGRGNQNANQGDGSGSESGEDSSGGGTDARGQGIRASVSQTSRGAQRIGFGDTSFLYEILDSGDGLLNDLAGESALNTLLTWHLSDSGTVQINESFDNEEIDVGAVGTTLGLASIGYVLWALRGGMFIATMYAGIPSWRMLDPASLLSAYRGADGMAQDKVEEMLD